MNEAPWSEEYVKVLNELQRCDNVHPYTCGNNSDHILRATPEGWVCDECPKEGKEYKQTWCH